MYRSDSAFGARGEPREEQVSSVPERSPEQAFQADQTSAALKRMVDVLGALTFFAVFFWLFAFVFLAVALTTGRPVIFRHTRVGLGGKTFPCLKFRSMVSNSDEVLAAHLAASPDARAEWARDFKLRDDPRVTRFGKFIRKSSLDELPQFWNVLKGDMSLVGPRPVTTVEVAKYYAGNDETYYSVRPGITGLWQVSGRSELNYAQRVELDVSYVENRSFLGDLTIIVKTVRVAASGRGSH